MIELRVDRGALVPADDQAREQLRNMNLALGEVIQAKIQQRRNPKFFRLAHQVARLARKNLEGFDYLDDHGALKRLQLEAGVQCQEMDINVPGFGKARVTVPRSLAFDSMSEEHFSETIKAICAYIAREYWPQCDADEVQRMAEVMID